MNREDARAIEQECARLVGLYANRNDAGAWAEVANLYVDGGRMSRPSAPDEWITGRDRILASFLARPPRKGRHLCTNVVIDVLSAAEARGETAIALFIEGCPPKLGTFYDTFVASVDG